MLKNWPQKHWAQKKKHWAQAMLKDWSQAVVKGFVEPRGGPGSHNSDDDRAQAVVKGLASA